MLYLDSFLFEWNPFQKGRETKLFCKSCLPLPKQKKKKTKKQKKTKKKLFFYLKPTTDY